MSASSGLSSEAPPAIVAILTEGGPVMTPVDRRLEEILQSGACPHTLIIQLKVDAAELRKKRVAVSKDLKNAMKRTKRIRDRAKQLSDADLVAVLRMRTEQKLGGGFRRAGDESSSPPRGHIALDKRQYYRL